MATRESADLGFDIVSLITISMFSIEIILSIIYKKDYICSFFFWLDLLSTLSMVLDVNLISNAMLSSSGG